MASVAQKLQSFREGQKATDDKTEIQKIKAMTLDQLALETISFGKAKIGQPFPKVFLDSAWTDWFVQTYEKSSKPAHQMYILYVEKRLNAELEKDFKPTPRKISLKETQKMAEAEAEAWDQISETDMFQELEIAGMGKLNQMEDQVTSLATQNQNLASRMTQIEMSMQELLHHVRNLSVKSEP